MTYEPKDVISRLDKEKAKRQVLDSHLQEVSDYCMPRKNDINRVQPQGNKREATLFDSTAERSCELLGGTLAGMFTNPTTKFIEFTTGDERLDEDDVVRGYLDDCASKVHTVLNQSNFQTEVHEYDLDLCWAGTAGMSIEEDNDTVVRFATRHISGYWIVENNKGMIDTVFRSWKWSLRNIVREYGVDALNPSLKKCFKENPDKEFNLVHLIEPNDPGMIKKYKQGPKGYPIASCHILVEEQLNLKEGGFREMPFIASRWYKASNEIYGRSPGMKVLADVKMINEMMKTTLKGAQKTVDPPLQAPDDGFILPLKTHPSGLNYYRAGSSDRIEAFGNDCRIDWGIQMLDLIHKAIREGFYVDQLQFTQGGTPMTATEVMQRVEQMLRFMGPMLGRQEVETLTPTMRRVFAIMSRKKMFMNPPEKLRGKGIAVRYSSDIAKVHRVAEGNNIIRAVQAVGPIAAADPTVVDNFDGDKIARHVVRNYGLPQSFLRDETERDALRQKKARDAEQARALDNQTKSADIAAKLGASAQGFGQAQASTKGTAA